jgi:ATP-dependent DNA helicase RecQ
MRELPTYGKGNMYSKEFWMKLMRQLISQALLKESNDQYPVLQLTEGSAAVLFHNRKVTALQIKEQAIAVKTNEPTYEAYDVEASDAGLFNLLRNLRREHAEAENVPPYVIFSDTTLKEMSAYLPQTLEELSQISGWGVFKLEKYGSSFLKLIVTYCRENSLSSQMHKKAIKKVQRPKVARESMPDTFQKTFHLYKEGNSIEDIALIRNLAKTTIEGHLSEFVANGQIPANRFLSDDRLAVIARVVEEKGRLSLKVIKDVLGDDYSYLEIRIAIAHMKWVEMR